MHTGFHTKLKKYCKSCHHTEDVSIFVHIDTDAIEERNDEYTAQVYDSETADGVSIKCSKCRSRNTVLLDYDLGDIIAALNMKGYATSFSCSGEYCDDGAIALPYIAFNNAPVEIFKSLPDGWYVSIDADFDRMRNNIQGMSSTIIRYNASDNDDERNIVWDKNAMKAWVDALPDNILNADMYLLRKHTGETYSIYDIPMAFDTIGYKVKQSNVYGNVDGWRSVNLLIEFKGKVTPFELLGAVFSEDNTSVLISVYQATSDNIRSYIIDILKEANISLG